MGYLSQKKHKFRENIFLITSVIILSIITGLYLLANGFYFECFNIFHVYCLSLVLLIYAIYIKKYKFALVYGVIILINFVLISANANIFFSKTFNGPHELTLPFSKESSLTQSYTPENIVSGGSLIVANKYALPYVNVYEGNIITIIKVDLEGASKFEYDVVFKQLKDFIINQDTPVIVFGKFGLPAWDRRFIKFLREAKLNVKNKFLFTGNSIVRFLKIPSFYILGFEEMGIKNLVVKSKANKETIDTIISFNSEDF